jgi:hypothetical protein
LRHKHVSLERAGMRSSTQPRGSPVGDAAALRLNVSNTRCLLWYCPYSWGLFLKGVARPPMVPLFGYSWRWRGLRDCAFPLYCTNPIHPSQGHGEWRKKFILVGSIPAGSSSASDGSLSWAHLEVAWASLPSRPHCLAPIQDTLRQGHWRIALSYSAVH